MKIGDRPKAHLKLAAILLLFMSLLFFIAWFSPDVFSYREMRKFWVLAGDLSVFLAAVSVGLWGAGKAALYAGQNRTGSLKWISGPVIFWLRKVHVLTGYLAFGLGYGHSVFFLANLSGRVNSAISGSAALLAMLVLTGLGVMRQHRMIRARPAVSWHGRLAAAFSVFLIIHI